MGFLSVFLVLLYFLPCIIAGLRNVRNCGSICAVNVFLGWTLIGWVVSLSWALGSKKFVRVEGENDPNYCDMCGYNKSCFYCVGPAWDEHLDIITDNETNREC